uniref:tRNA (adenosine(37)-N6)-threonylcarbamoyltransferase complex dimerization subunit type 1 TsaB n=1 Tax=Ningiella ruwaisensis TaxID=2364274 RepID=UPI0010A01F67|nr:tRNA (adenosine(37)-N6)-threonylcarbamoyltransferase complex dimerization subunit type 1 TsaB [Ningiella ruwaisensis]
MKILAIDTATEACSAALLIEEQGEVTIDEIFEVCPQQQSQRILPMLDELLSRNNLNVSDLDALAYGRGPGSFTGVRIASSTIQGLALGADLPVLEISTLAAMSQECAKRCQVKHVLSLIDARMGEVYFGLYEYDLQTGVVSLLGQEAVIPPADVIHRVARILPEKHESIMSEFGFAGTGFDAYRQELGEKLQINGIKVNYPSAKYMLPLAKKMLESGNTVNVEDISPVYLRDKVTWKKLPNK